MSCVILEAFMRFVPKSTLYRIKLASIRGQPRANYPIITLPFTRPVVSYFLPIYSFICPEYMQHYPSFQTQLNGFSENILKHYLTKLSGFFHLPLSISCSNKIVLYSKLSSSMIWVCLLTFGLNCLSCLLKIVSSLNWVQSHRTWLLS